MQSILTKLQSKLEAAKGNKSALRREATVLERTEKLQGELAAIALKMKAFQAQLLAEAPIHSEAQFRRDNVGSLASGDTFPPKDMDLREAVAACVRVTFAAERRLVLNERHRALDLQRAELDKQLRELQAELNGIQSELAG
jgi:hypothetical protein